jgi:hypothetical protein
MVSFIRAVVQTPGAAHDLSVLEKGARGRKKKQKMKEGKVQKKKSICAQTVSRSVQRVQRRVARLVPCAVS